MLEYIRPTSRLLCRMLENLDPGGLFQDSGFSTFGIIVGTSRVANYQYTSAGKVVAKRLEMVLSISECLVLSISFSGRIVRSGTRFYNN